MVRLNHFGATKEKTCPVCGTAFKPKSGINKFCTETCKGKWKYLAGQVTTESQYKNISGNWTRYFSRLVAKSFRRGNLTREDLLELLEKQGGKCALSGRTLTCILEKGQKCKTNASIDRLRAGQPYTKDNIQLVCRALNSWRGDVELEEFINWCRAVSEHNGKST